MAVKKKDDVKEPKKEVIPVKAEKPKKKPAAGGFFIYIGPSIRGVIQNSMILEGPKENALQFLAEQIAKYPLIAKLIVSNITFAEDRLKVQTPGNVLNEYYKQLAGTKIK